MRVERFLRVGGVSTVEAQQIEAPVSASAAVVKQPTNERSFAGAIFTVVAVLSLALSAIVIVYVLGIRSKSSTVRNAARRYHHALGNPLQMRSAGMPGTYASVIRHRGRTTGKTYETPVWAAPTEDGFVIRIVYGSRTDWLQNVLASGAAAIVQDGHTYPVDRPEIVPMDSAEAYFPPMIQRIDNLIRVDECLRVRRAEAEKMSSLVGPKEEKHEAAD